MKINLRFAFFLLSVFILVSAFAPSSIFAQRRDHLTESEVELIRDVQEIDGRMRIYLKAIDRRLLVLNNDAAQAAPIAKESERWGELPKGTRAQLLRDIAEILDESISKVDDLAAHDDKNKLFPVAINILADGANRLLPELKAQLLKAADEQEKGSILSAIEYCDQIIEASAKVPKLSEKERKKIQKDVQKELEKNQPPT